jgi:hypothetical protein
MGDGLAPLLLYALFAIVVVFLIGFGIVSSVSLVLSSKPRNWDFPFFLRIGVLSILGGLLAIKLLPIGNEMGNRYLYAKREAFGQKMAQVYPLEIKYQPGALQHQQFKLIFSVPVSGSYSLDVLGFPAREKKFSPALRDAVIVLHQYDVELDAGTNELVFGFADQNNWLQTDPSIDFLVVIKPLQSREELLRPGSDRVELTEGINYHSSNMFASSCLNDLYRPIPCVENNGLHVEAH